MKCCPTSILTPDLESSHRGASFTSQNERIVNTLFLTPHCNFKTLVNRGMVMNFFRNETFQCVSTETGHDKIIGARCIVEKMPLVMHSNAQSAAGDECLPSAVTGN